MTNDIDTDLMDAYDTRYDTDTCACDYDQNCHICDPDSFVSCDDDDDYDDDAVDYSDDAVDWDSFVLRSAGWGDDEDYGFGGRDEF
jgi:hypothetical protein